MLLDILLLFFFFLSNLKSHFPAFLAELNVLDIFSQFDIKRSSMATNIIRSFDIFILRISLFDDSIAAAAAATIQSRLYSEPTLIRFHLFVHKTRIF